MSRIEYLYLIRTTIQKLMLSLIEDRDLFLAGQIIDKSPEKIEQVESYIHSHEILSIHNVSAYALENGSCRTMLDKETGLIDAEILDSVSGKINSEFDNLLNVQHGD